MLISKLSKNKSVLIANCFLYATALLITVGLKYHYSLAGGDALGWILGPTASVVEYSSGIPFEREAGTGYINHEFGIIIAPACAGINFLIIAFCMAAYSGVHRLRSSRSKFIWLGISFGCAYIQTIVVNALRIIVSIYTINANVQYQWITPDRLHRIEGVFIYFFFLCLFYFILEKIFHSCTRDDPKKMKGSVNKNNNYSQIIVATFIPFFWYGFFTMGIPFLNRSHNENNPQFFEHCLVILSVCAVVIIFIFMIQLCWRRIRSKIGYNGRRRVTFGQFRRNERRMNIQRRHNIFQ